MAEPLTKEAVLEALKRVKGPGAQADIVAQGLVSEIVIHKGKVYFAIHADPARPTEFEPVRQAAETAVRELPGVEAVAVTLTADRAPDGNGGAQAAAHLAVAVDQPDRAGRNDDTRPERRNRLAVDDRVMGHGSLLLQRDHPQTIDDRRWHCAAIVHRPCGRPILFLKDYS